MNCAKNCFITLNVLMTFELSSFKIEKTCCKPEFIKNICNPSEMTWWNPGHWSQNNFPVSDWHLKTFGAHDVGIQNIVWTKKSNHLFKKDKYYGLFLIYMKQLSLSSYMTVKKTLHIISWTRLFRWDIYWRLDCQICTLSS